MVYQLLLFSQQLFKKLTESLHSWWFWGLSVLVCVQALDIYNAVASLEFLISSEPFVRTDYSVYYYWTERAVRFMEASGRSWGYDPFYAAGYPLSFVWNSGTPIQALAILTTPWLAPAVVLKGFYVAIVLLLPLVGYWSSRAFGASPAVAFLTAVLFIVVSRTGIHSFMQFVGMLPGYAVSYGGVWGLAILQAYALKQHTLRWFHFVGCALAMGALFWLHKTALVILAPPALVLLLLLPNSRRLFLVGAGLVAVLLNSYWLAPFLQLYSNKRFIEEVQDWTSAKTLENILHFPVFEPFGHYAVLFWIQTGLVILAVIGLWHYAKQHRKAAYFLLFSILYLAFISYAGQYVYHLRLLNPYRYVIPLYLLCAIPAAMALRMWSDSWHRYGLLLISLAALLIFPSFHHIHRTAQLQTSLPPHLEELKQWIQSNTTSEGRILLEDWGYHEYYSSAPYDSSGFPALISIFTNRHFIGGPYAYNHLKHAQIDFKNGRVFGKPWDAFSKEELQRYLSIYNVHWIIAWTPESITFLNQQLDLVNPLHVIPYEYPHRQVTPIKTGFRLYEVRNEGSFLLEGTADLQIEVDRITLNNIETPNGRLRLSMHWAPFLQTEPQRPLNPFFLLDDPAGFIEIENPPKSLVIQ